MPEYAAAQMLAKQDVYHVRLTGMILAALVERNVLTASEARSLVDEVAEKMPPDLAPFREVFRELSKEFD